MAFSDAEKVAVRYHLGYQNVSTPTAIALGYPSASHLAFILDSSLNSMLPESLPFVRRCIQELQCIEDQMSSFRSSLLVTSTGGTTLRGSGAFLELENQYRNWCQKLADVIGTPVNPFSLHHQQLGTMGGGVIEPA